MFCLLLRWHVTSCNLPFGPYSALGRKTVIFSSPDSLPSIWKQRVSQLLSYRLNIQVAVLWPSARVPVFHRKLSTSDSRSSLTGTRKEGCFYQWSWTWFTSYNCSGFLDICITLLIHSKLVANKSPWVFSQVSYCCWARWTPNPGYCSWSKWFC